jgi:hypothetical protein
MATAVAAGSRPCSRCAETFDFLKKAAARPLFFGRCSGFCEGRVVASLLLSWEAREGRCFLQCRPGRTWPLRRTERSLACGGRGASLFGARLLLACGASVFWSRAFARRRRVKAFAPRVTRPPKAKESPALTTTQHTHCSQMKAPLHNSSKAKLSWVTPQKTSPHPVCDSGPYWHGHGR